MAAVFWTLVCSLAFLLIYLIHRIKQKKLTLIETKGSAVYLGNSLLRSLEATIKKTNPLDNLVSDYNKIKTSSAKFGLIDDLSSSRCYLVSDLDTLKQIYLTDFDHFTDRFHMEATKSDPVTYRSLFTKRGEEWKAIRTTLSPTFSSRNIKMFYKKFDETGKRMVEYVQISIKKNNGLVEVDRVLSKYSIDLISSVTYGVDCHAFDVDGLAYFEKMAKDIQFQFGFVSVLKLLTLRLSPRLAGLLNFTVFNQKSINYFWEVGKRTLNARRGDQTQPSNLVELIVSTTESKGYLEEEIEQDEAEFIINNKAALNSTSEKIKSLKLSSDDIAANAIVFILGGYDTTMLLNKMSLYCLAKFPDVQRKVYEEIVQVLDENGREEFTYEVISKMEYLTLFVNEVLRMYPPAVITERICTKPFKIDDDLTIRKGDRISVPMYAFHHDSQYFKKPEEFDPERFSRDRRNSIPAYSYMPFGHGPRNCIGFRMAVAEAKVAIAHLVKNFVISLDGSLLEEDVQLSLSAMGSLTVEQPICGKLMSRSNSA